MQKLFLSLMVGLWALFSAAHAQDTTRITLLFKNNSHLLDEAEQSKIKQQLAGSKAHFLYITGHTDGRASDAYNEALARRRVKAVQEFVIQLGISQDSLKLEAFGERQPIATNETDEGRAQNRRVEVYWITQLPTEPYTTIADLYCKIARKPQVFWIRADQERDTIIEAQQGTRFLIPKGAFRCDAHFDYGKKIRFEVKEFLTAGEMLRGNLHSMSEDSILQTGGMMHITAFQGKKQLELCADRPIAFFVPSENPMEKMYRFDGLEDSRTGLDWRQGDSLRVFGLASPNVPIYLEDTIFNRVHLASGLKNHLEKVPRGEYSNTFRRMVYTSRQLRGVIASNTSFSYGEGWSLNWRAGEGNCTIWDYDPITGESYVEKWESFTRYLDNPPAICDTVFPQPMFAPNYPPLSPELQQLVNGAIGYLGRTANLGYINCDRFARSFYRMRRIRVRTDVLVDSTTDVKLIISRVRGIMTSPSRWQNEKEKNRFSFDRVPPGLNATLLGLRYEKGKAYLAISRIRTGSKVQSLTFKPVEEKEIPSKLAEIGF